MKTRITWSAKNVTNASRHWVHGELDLVYGDPLLSFMSQMPLGIGFMGNLAVEPAFVIDVLSQMPLGIGFMGNILLLARRKERLDSVTNASRHWVHGEQENNTQVVDQQYVRHKCLSALGSWGTAQRLIEMHNAAVTNASRHWVHGELAEAEKFHEKAWSQMPLGIGFMGNSSKGARSSCSAKKSQMPLGIGFMGNRAVLSGVRQTRTRHKCLSALGSWGTEAGQRAFVAIGSHKCLSALGSWGTVSM